MTSLKRALCRVMGHDWGPWWLDYVGSEAIGLKRTCRRCHEVERKSVPMLVIKGRLKRGIVGNNGHPS